MPILTMSSPGAQFPLLEDDAWITLEGEVESRLIVLHEEIRRHSETAGLDRISVAVHDAQTRQLRTFMESNIGPRPLERITDSLDHHPALVRVATSGRPWINNAIATSATASAGSAKGVIRYGYQSRYVVRIQRHDTLFGFLFFNSRQPGFFTEAVVAALMPYRRLIDVLVVGKLTSQRAMLAAVRTALQVSQYRDEETGAHLDRMSHYAELIAQHIAVQRDLSDEYVEYVHQYAPLHDIGKVGVPDNILLKPGKLTPDEFDIMKMHVNKGVAIIDAMVHDHGLAALPHRTLLRNVVECHHEYYNGSGYPNGLCGEDIPLEGRIVSVADVFDALTSRRPYKEAWTYEEAAAFLRAQAGQKFDPECVDALLADPVAIRRIQQRFQDPQP